MTRDEFLNIDAWNDNQVNYDILVGNFRRIAYISPSRSTLYLVAANKDFPIYPSNCEVQHNICPADIINFLNYHTEIDIIQSVIDNTIHTITPKMYTNEIDEEVLFPIISEL